MPDFGAITTLLSSFKTAQNIASGFLELKTMAEVQGKVIELQSVIMTAQSSAMSAQTEFLAAQRRIEELVCEMDRLRAWATEKARYKLTAVHKDTFAYVLRPEFADSEPVHWLCANCVSHGDKAILQRARESYGQTTYHCQRCNSDIRVGESRPPMMQPARSDFP